jgi:hypothetical protein
MLLSFPNSWQFSYGLLSNICRSEVNELVFDGVEIDNYMELLSLPVAEMFGQDGKTKISRRPFLIL